MSPVTLQSAREHGFRKLGRLGDRVLSRSTPMRPTDAGTALFMWPAQAIGKIRIIHRERSVLLATDGISDPWDRGLHPDAPKWTFGYEAALEVPLEHLPGTTEEAIAGSWLPTLLWAMTDWMVAERFDLKAVLLKFGCATVAIPRVGGLDSFIAANGFMGGLLGIPLVGDVLRTQVALAPDGPDAVWLLPLKLLTPDEYDWAMAVNDGANAIKLAEGFLRRGDRHLTWPGRPSILSEMP